MTKFEFYLLLVSMVRLIRHYLCSMSSQGMQVQILSEATSFSFYFLMFYRRTKKLYIFLKFKNLQANSFTI